jgi:hypothetical protein
MARIVHGGAVLLDEDLSNRVVRARSAHVKRRRDCGRIIDACERCAQTPAARHLARGGIELLVPHDRGARCRLSRATFEANGIDDAERVGRDPGSNQKEGEGDNSEYAAGTLTFRHVVSSSSFDAL